jgi:hypothetical protein
MILTVRFGVILDNMNQACLMRNSSYV